MHGITDEFSQVLRLEAQANYRQVAFHSLLLVYLEPQDVSVHWEDIDDQSNITEDAF